MLAWVLDMGSQYWDVGRFERSFKMRWFVQAIFICPWQRHRAEGLVGKRRLRCLSQIDEFSPVWMRCCVPDSLNALVFHTHEVDHV